MNGLAGVARRRFRPGLWPTLGAIALVAATLSLGNWQRHRAEEKAGLQAQFDTMRALPPEPLSSLIDSILAHPDMLRYRSVTLAGEYDAARQIYLDNRVHQGRSGYEVVTPMRVEGSMFRGP